MLLQVAPYPWTCLVTSFAMAFDRNVKVLIKDIGHNGGEVWWPDLPEPYCYRGHHIQEMICVGVKYGFCVTPFQSYPTAANGLKVQEQMTQTRRFMDKEIGLNDFIPTIIDIAMAREIRDVIIPFSVTDFMRGRTGVIINDTHAMAWNGSKIYDPSGGIRSLLPGESINEFWWVKSESSK